MFSHQAVIMCFRVAREQMAEDEVLRVDREDPLPNCSVTTYRRSGREAGGDRLELARYADTTAVESAEEPTTRETPSSGEAAAK